MKLKLDLHIHTYFSSDCKSPIEAIAERLEAMGFHGYAITDHDTTQGIPEVLRKKGDLVVIPGVEISARGAHIVALDIQEPVPPHLDIGETVDLIQGQGATAVLAHPYGIPRSWTSVRNARDAGFDAIEVANGAQIPYALVMRYNLRMAEELQLPQTGGSDSHIPETVGRCYTIVDAKSKERDDVIRAIRLGRTEVGGKGTSVGERLRKIWRQYLGG